MKLDEGGSPYQRVTYELSEVAVVRADNRNTLNSMKNAAFVIAGGLAAFVAVSAAFAGEWLWCFVAAAFATYCFRQVRHGRRQRYAIPTAVSFDFLGDGDSSGSTETPAFATVAKKAAPPRKRESNRKLVNNTWPALGEYEVDVFGESNYQAVLLRIVGGDASHWIESVVLAELVCEPQEQQAFPDTGDVSVFIGGAKVGELRAGDAICFRRRLIRHGIKGQKTHCNALIRGGGPRGDGTNRMLGVRLDLRYFR